MADSIDVEIIEQTIEVELLNGATWAGLEGKPATYPPADHEHEVADITDFPTSIPAAPHTHDDRYYTENEADTLLGNKVDKVTGSALISTNTLTTLLHRQRLNLINMFKI